MRNALLVVFVSFMSLPFYAQNWCAQHILENRLRAEDPELNAYIEAQDSLMVALQANGNPKRAEKIIIPVVFHVIHLNGDENINDDQIHSAIRILNEDFNALNDELDDIVPSFENIVGNAEIEFRLATTDPDGNPTNGIDRIESSQTNVGDDNAKLNQWPRDDYYNIWTTNVIGVGNAAAYAYRPPAAHGMPGVDGVISNHVYVGDIGTSSQSGSKTLSHESAHFLNLIHTWGSTNFPGCDGTSTNPNDPCFQINNCASDDQVFDTPNTIGTTNGNCFLSQNTCSSLDNVQNFMDYSDCESMFSEGQVSRMRSALNSNTADRKQLWTSSNLQETGVSELTEARYYVERNTACRGEQIQFYDESRYDAESWEWELVGPTTLTSEEQNPVFTFGEPGVYTVNLTVTKGEVTQSISDVDAFAVSDIYGTAVPFFEDFQNPKPGWIDDRNEVYNDYHWQYSESSGYDDDACYFVSNVGNESKNNKDLIFSSIDFRSMTSVEIEFKVAYTRINNDDNDELSVAFSNDCGETWFTFWSRSSAILNGSKPISSSVFVPSSQQDWETFTVSNIPLLWLEGGDAMVRFRFTPGGGNQLFLDNIEFDGEYSDVPVLVSPSNGAPSTKNEAVINWNAIPGVDEYDFEVSENSEFTSIMSTGTKEALGDGSTGEDTQYKNTNLVNGSTYFWRVRSIDNNTPSDWSETWSFTVAEDGVGIAEARSESLTMYPNPASDRLVVEIPKINGNLRVKVFNVSGQLVDRHNIKTSGEPTTFQLNTSEFPSGTYFLNVGSANRIWNKRFIVNH